MLSSPPNANLLLKVIQNGLEESQCDLEIQRKDQNSPLYSVKSFEALRLYAILYEISSSIKLNCILQESFALERYIFNGVQQPIENTS